MHGVDEMALLKRVSRSFYLSMRVLPAPMRRGVALGYLLARASDTLADSQNDPQLLADFEKHLEGGPAIDLPDELPGHPGEKELLGHLSTLVARLDNLPTAQALLVREVLAIILSGQRLDMARFERADAAHPVRLADATELEDYTWRVAGCVGQFWTQLGFLTLGERFSDMHPDALERLGIRFGQGLQLVNILRDESADLAQGRAYLPTPRTEWMAKARENLAAGLAYADAMHLKRLHIAVALPARIGLDTLDAMEVAAGSGRVKIPRWRVWKHFLESWLSS